MRQNEKPQPGQLVRSKAGHDKGRLYLVVQQASERILVTDGKHRPLDRLKPKNLRHLKIIETKIAADLMGMISRPGDPGSKNAHIRDLLARYERSMDK